MINEARSRQSEPPLDIMALPLDDPASFELLKSGNTTAVFQLESRGMRQSDEAGTATGLSTHWRKAAEDVCKDLQPGGCAPIPPQPNANAAACYLGPAVNWLDPLS